MASDGIRLVVNKKCFDTRFVHDYINSSYFRKKAIEASTGSTRQRIGLEDLKKLPFVAPPLSEQHAIATALSDVDALITSLDRLIAKKHDIKQATMQQLLTGKTRLPGFSGELKQGYKGTEVGIIPADWEVKKLGEVADFLDGRRRPINERDRAKMRGEYPYYGASGVVDYVNDYIFNEELILLGEDGENILSRNCKLACRVSGKIWVNNHAHVLRPKANTDASFLTEYLESLDYEQYNTGTAQPKLNKRVCSEIIVFLPSLTEQRAIATVLSDMDAEITALEQKRDKTRALKQGMMQELLTGKTRLV
jgi:type I restriction enzyme, S subunit